MKNAIADLLDIFPVQARKRTKKAHVTAGVTSSLLSQSSQYGDYMTSSLFILAHPSYQLLHQHVAIGCESFNYFMWCRRKILFVVLNIGGTWLSRMLYICFWIIDVAQTVKGGEIACFSEIKTFQNAYRKNDILYLTSGYGRYFLGIDR